MLVPEKPNRVAVVVEGDHQRSDGSAGFMKRAGEAYGL
jgi:hypothetical protein